ncbi:MAG: (d)CMP kinase [Lachnospirales bacterium]
MSFKVAVDGTTSSGKGSVAKKVGEHFNLLYIDTGAMYRVVALNSIKNNIPLLPENEEKILAITKNIKMDFDFSSYPQKIFLDGDNVSEIIRTVEAGENASKVAVMESIREFLVKYQQNIAMENDVVMDGRDIGSVVLKNADIKLYLDADSLTRAKRRCSEVLAKGHKVDLEGVKLAIEQRDHRDKTRENSPLVLCDDAIYIDTSEKNLDEVLDEVYQIINNKKASK